MAFNTDELIRVVYQGQALPATQPIPPNVPGHDDTLNVAAPYDPAAARALLDKFGYVDRNGDGWRDLPDGKPLTLVMASTPTTRDREIDEIWQKNLKAIGIRVEFIKQKWPDLLKMGKAGQLQFWRVGWINAYAEGDAFAQLLYGKNIGQTNYARFDLPAYDDAVSPVADAARWRGAQQAVSAHVGARRRVQPVGAARVHGREHAAAAVGARLQEARVLGASVAVHRRRHRAARGR